MPHHAPISVSTVVLDGHPLQRGLDLLAKAGARHAEPAYIEGYMPFDEATFTERSGLQLAQGLRQAGLGIRALSAHIDLGQPDSPDKLRRRLDFAAAAGASVLISNATTVDRAADLRACLERTAPDLMARGMTLCLENPGHGRGALLPAGARGAAVIARLGIAQVRMNYDVGNAASYGARAMSAREDLLAALPVTAHLHLKDLTSVGPDWRFCPLGAGDIGYAALLASVDLPPDLPVGIEYPARLWRPGRGDPQRLAEVPDSASVVASLRASLAFLAAALDRDLT